MAYLGNSPARSFISFERQVFTIVNSQTAYTLDHSVTNENDIRLVVNNVVQEPGSGKAYTASGTTLTLSAALTNGTDEMYCVFLGRATATEAPGAGSVGTSQLTSDAVTTAKITDLNVTTAKIAADAINGDKIADDSISDEHLDPTAITGQTAETTIASDDLILLSDTSASGALKKMTQANFISGVGQTNTPYFYARLGSDQSVGYTGNTTKIALNTEILDSASAYDTSTYRFTPQTAGKYFFYGQIYFETTSSANNYNNLVTLGTIIQKNGSSAAHNYIFRGNQASPCRRRNLGTSVILDMNGSSDYVELYAYSDSHLAGDCNAAADVGGSTFLFGYFVAT